MAEQRDGEGFRRSEGEALVLALRKAAAWVQSQPLSRETMAVAEKGFAQALSVLSDLLKYWLGKREEAIAQGEEPSLLVESSVLALASALLEAMDLRTGGPLAEDGDGTNGASDKMADRTS